jgi:hypothetical protein
MEEMYARTFPAVLQTMDLCSTCGEMPNGTGNLWQHDGYSLIALGAVTLRGFEESE